MSNQPKEDIVTALKNDAILDKKIDRRDLLKKMIITGGVVATSQLIPGEWIKPVIGVGTLPAHAQGSADAPADAPVDAPADDSPAALTSETILGSWTVGWTDESSGETGTDTAIFYADGTILMSNGTETGAWTLEGTTLTVIDGDGTSVVTVSGNADAFTGTGEDGVITFTRIS